MKIAEEEAAEHGIETACYTNTPDGYVPYMGCLCGFATGRGCATWAEAGEELDAHLDACKKRTETER